MDSCIVRRSVQIGVEFWLEFESKSSIHVFFNPKTLIKSQIFRDNQSTYNVCSSDI